MPQKKYNPIRFAIIYVVLFAGFYYFNIFYLGITSPGNHYSPFLAEHLNYIQWLRDILLFTSKHVLVSLGFAAITNHMDLLVAGRGHIFLAYDCLGFGIMSFLAAFVIAYPKTLKQKIIFLASSILILQVLNVVRFVLLALYWKPEEPHVLDHHTIFNAVIYLLIMVSLYFWVIRELKPTKKA